MDRVVLPDPRAEVIRRLLKGKVEVDEAALLLDLSARSIRRLRERFIEGGPAALAHGNAGHLPAHALDPILVARVAAFAKDGYAGLNDSHLRDLLEEREGILLSRASVRRILRREGLASPRPRRAPRFRSRRERRTAAGMLVQLDGSRHRWLGPAGPELTLLGAIDDATGTVCAAVFREQEDAAGYLTVLRDLVRGQGVPLAVYNDRHSVFWIKPRLGQTLEDEQGRERQPTQLGRAFAELGVEMIFASSPQAKGRIERLWGTLQDRLLQELRLAGAQTIDAANAFLPGYLARHNHRFAVAPVDSAAAWRERPADIEAICCLKYARHVAADNTLRHEGVTVQLPPRVRGTYAHLRVEVRHHLDGSVGVHLPGGKQLARSARPTTPPRFRPQSGTRAPVGGVQPDPRNVDRSHPWRQWKPGQLKTKLHIPKSELG